MDKQTGGSEFLDYVMVGLGFLVVPKERVFESHSGGVLGHIGKVEGGVAIYKIVVGKL